MVQNLKAIGYFDGASRGNPGEAGAGALIKDYNGKVLWQCADYLGDKTNNEAEYNAVIRLLKAAAEMGVEEIKIHGDSNLVVKQLSRIGRIKEPRLAELAKEAWDAAKGMKVTAPNYLMINCFWVSGQYKGQGHGYNLLQSVIEDAKKQQKNGLVTVVGTKKNHFMSDTKWLLKHGFEEIERLPNGFSLLAMNICDNGVVPYFNDCAKIGECTDKQGLVAYYSSRCPYTDYYVNGMLRVLAQEKSIPLKVIKK